jgi:reactive intermediate/imine deaminase
MRVIVIAICLAAAVACAAPPAPPAPVAPPPANPNPEFINLVEPFPYPFSSAVKIGNLIYVSGQIGSRVENGAPVLVKGGIEAESRQALDNVKAVLEKAGTSMDRVVKCTVMLADMKEWPKLNAIYATYFPGPKPARAAFGATALAMNARVEVDCIAAAK